MTTTAADLYSHLELNIQKSSNCYKATRDGNITSFQNLHAGMETEFDTGLFKM